MFLTLYIIGCGPAILDQNRNKALEPSQKPETTLAQKPETTLEKNEESIFTVIEIEDLEYPTLAASIRLPYRANPKNTVVLVAEHAYVTTERHLHVIDISKPQFPLYQTSLAFQDEIGKVLTAGNQLVLASPKKFHIVDVSQPSRPILRSTQNLPEQYAIKDIGVRDNYLYALGENDHLYVFTLFNGKTRLIDSIEMLRDWWLLSPRDESHRVEQIELNFLEKIPSAISEPLRSQRGFLEILSGKNQKVRASSNLVVIEGIQHPMRPPQGDLLIYSVINKDDVAGQKWGSRFDHMFGRYHPKSNFVGKDKHGNKVGTFDARNSYHLFGEHYYVWAECLQHLVMKHPIIEEKAFLARRKPTISYVVIDGKMRQIDHDPSSEMIDIYDNKLAGPVTDFQIYGNLLYVVNEMGFFSIRTLTTVKDFYQGIDPHFISVTPLQANSPISLAVDKNFAYVLSIKEGVR